MNELFDTSCPTSCFNRKYINTESKVCFISSLIVNTLDSSFIINVSAALFWCNSHSSLQSALLCDNSCPLPHLESTRGGSLIIFHTDRIYHCLLSPSDNTNYTERSACASHASLTPLISNELIEASYIQPAWGRVNSQRTTNICILCTEIKHSH